MCSFEANIEGKATAPASAPYLRPVGNSGLLAKYPTKNECILASGKSRMT